MTDVDITEFKVEDNKINVNKNAANDFNKIATDVFHSPYPNTLRDLQKERRQSFTSFNVMNQDDINSMSSGGNFSKGSEDDAKKGGVLTKKIPSRKPSLEFMCILYNKGVAPKKNNKNLGKFKKEIKLNKDNPFLYSYSQLHPFSIFYGTKYSPLFNKQKELNFPAPRFITSEEWMKEPDLSKESIFKGTKFMPKLGLIITDPKVQEKYKGLLSDIIVQILKVPFGHHISLNIKMFEPKCLQERFSSAFSYAPKYLTLMEDPDLNPLERFKYFITFLTSALYTIASQLKPFNPFLGETFQGEFPNGDKLYIEQVTHNPLCTRFFLRHKTSYELSGYLNFSVKSEGLGSCMYIVEKGPVVIKYLNTDDEFIGTLPYIKVVNARSEKDRASILDGNAVFINKKSKLKAVVKYNTNKQNVGAIYGNVFKFSYPENYKFEYEKEIEFTKKFKLGKSNNYKIICDISGNYLENLTIGKKVYWDIDTQNPSFIRPVKSCLPSDGRFREDLIWLYRSFYCANNEEERMIYQSIAQEWKIMMEEFNRWERKRRNDLRPAILKALKQKNDKLNKSNKKTK